MIQIYNQYEKRVVMYAAHIFNDNDINLEIKDNWEFL